MEMLNSLTVVQWVFVVVGFLIAMSGLFPLLKEKFLAMDFTGGDDDMDDDDFCPVLNDGYELTLLVSKWEALADACEFAELDEACEKLNEVFPLLIKVRKTNDEE